MNGDRFNRIPAIEIEFNEARDKLKDLLEQVQGDNDPESRSAIKLSLDLITGLIRLSKEQMTLYVKHLDKIEFIEILEDLADRISEIEDDNWEKVVVWLEERLKA
ncbi:MAG TPA: hypothetical protein VGB30_08415 [bacterium]|jgi:hypothetical protein